MSSAVSFRMTAKLSAGGVSVDPASSPVPSDATMTYTAPDQPNKGGTVSLEGHSKRGVARGDVEFQTDGAAYLIVGEPEDWHGSQVICDVMQPFTLATGIGSMQLSGGLTGTYEFAGAFNSHYTGTYAIAAARARSARLDDRRGRRVDRQSGRLRIRELRAHSGRSVLMR